MYLDFYAAKSKYYQMDCLPYFQLSYPPAPQERSNSLYLVNPCLNVYIFIYVESELYPHSIYININNRQNKKCTSLKCRCFDSISSLVLMKMLNWNFYT